MRNLAPVLVGDAARPFGVPALADARPERRGWIGV